MLKTFKGIPLSMDEQSILSKDMHDYGNLRGRLETYFKTRQFKQDYRKYQKYRKTDNAIGAVTEGSRSEAYRQSIINKINQIYVEAKEAAVNEGRLAQVPSFMAKRASLSESDGFIPEDPEADTSPMEGLIRWAEKVTGNDALMQYLNR